MITYCSQLSTVGRFWQPQDPYRSRHSSWQTYHDGHPFSSWPSLKICLREQWQLRSQSNLLGLLGVRCLVRVGTYRHEDGTRPKIVGSPLSKYLHIYTEVITNHWDIRSVVKILLTVGCLWICALWNGSFFSCHSIALSERIWWRICKEVNRRQRHKRGSCSTLACYCTWHWTLLKRF